MKTTYGQLLDLMKNIKDHSKTYNFKVRRDAEIELVFDDGSIGAKVVTDPQ